jgi:hypothetical protein
VFDVSGSKVCACSCHPAVNVSGTQRLPGSPKQSALIIDQIIADGAVVEFASSQSGTEPLKFEIHKLTLNSVADDRPMSFHAALLNAKPPGEIRTDGQFGPLQPQDVGQTRLSGSYDFQRADLGGFSGIGGTLASTGKFNGVLEHIEIEGSTDTPDFQVTQKRSCGTPENAIPWDCERDGWRRLSAVGAGAI